LDPAPQSSADSSNSEPDCFSEVHEFVGAGLRTLDERIRTKLEKTMWRPRSELPWWLIFIAVIGAGLLGGADRMEGQDSPPAMHVPSTYTLGPNDQISFWGIDADEIVNKQFRIDPEGDVSLPMVGRLRAAGLTIRQFEEVLNKRLSAYIREPHIVVTVVEFRSQPVSVVGAVKSPGTHQLEGRKTLVEIISLAGGFREDAGNCVKITREAEWGTIPLPKSSVDPRNKSSVAEVNIKDILEARNPEDNILVMPHDVISVPKAELVYVIGDVKKSGGFILAERDNMSLLQALSLAEGLERTADPRHAKILRTVPGQEHRQEIGVDVRKILEGKSEDISLQAGDILFMPDSTAKKVGTRSLEAVVQAATGLAIWRVP
jgi:polysaccharide export outer membrane protein